MLKRIPYPRSFRDISKHRQFLYGFAALWIMFYHMGSKVPAEGIWKPLSFFQSTGACGVEIFLLLTGFGLYSSMKKDPSLGSFYTKRFMRVFLPAFIVVAVANAFKDHSLMGYLAASTFFGFWLGVGTPWYVSFILTCYVVYPIIFKLTDKKPKVLWAGIILSVVFCLILDMLPNKPADYLMRALSRIPVFLVGCALAPYFERDKRIPGWLMPAVVIATIPVMIISYRMFSFGFTYFFRGLAYFFFASALILIICTVAGWLSKCRFGRIVYRCFGFSGGISLEIYLLFGCLYEAFGQIPGFQAHASGGLKQDVAAAICTIILSVTLQAIVDCMIRKFSSVRIPEPEGR